jgi:hypothetical protein
MQLDYYYGEHEGVLLEALWIYKNKSQIRGQMWLEWPPSDKIRELRERVMRIEAAYINRERIINDQSTEALDTAIIEDSIDVINYAAFLIKQIRRDMSG